MSSDSESRVRVAPIRTPRQQHTPSSGRGHQHQHPHPRPLQPHSSSPPSTTAPATTSHRQEQHYKHHDHGDDSPRQRQQQQQPQTKRHRPTTATTTVAASPSPIPVPRTPPTTTTTTTTTTTSTSTASDSAVYGTHNRDGAAAARPSTSAGKRRQPKADERAQSPSSREQKRPTTSSGSKSKGEDKLGEEFAPEPESQIQSRSPLQSQPRGYASHSSPTSQRQVQRPHTSAGSGPKKPADSDPIMGGSVGLQSNSRPVQGRQSKLAQETAREDDEEHEGESFVGVRDDYGASDSDGEGAADIVVKQKQSMTQRPFTASAAEGAISARENKRKKQLEQMERRKLRSRQGVLATTDRPLTASGSPSTPRVQPNVQKVVTPEESTSPQVAISKAHVEEFKLKDQEESHYPSVKQRSRHEDPSDIETASKEDDQAEIGFTVEETPDTASSQAALALSGTSKKKRKHTRESSEQNEVEMTSLAHPKNIPSDSASVSQKSPLPSYTGSNVPGTARAQWNSPLDSLARYKPTPTPTLRASDVPAFLHTPGPRGYMTMCKIQVASKGFGHPTYLLYLEETNQFVVAARRRVRSKSSNYLISTDSADLARNSPCFAGKVRSNFLGTEFIVYDTGDNPKKAVNAEMSRCELACVTYGSNPLGLHGPRKMVVLLPKRDPATGGYIGNRPDSAENTLLARYKANDLENIVCLHNKAPVWNQATQAYVLNFHRRVKVASVKNFQMVSSDSAYSDVILMQFGRVSSNMFILDYQYPLTLMQAFGIALTSFDKKLACE
ncbi:TULP3 protein [Pelomyxa schiedti]|nr:TULP3 protein [Pelomyxa schiedti]